jgi:hypothetical protein
MYGVFDLYWLQDDEKIRKKKLSENRKQEKALGKLPRKS